MTGGQAVALGAIFVLQACGQPATQPPDTPGPAAATNEGGLIVSLSVDQPAVLPGNQLRFHAQIRNTSSASVLWWGGDCKIDGAVSVVAGEVVDPLPGVAWAGDARALKALLVEGSGVPAPPQTQVDLHDGTACRVDRGFNNLRPEDVISLDSTWSASDRIGAPLRPGRYQISATFPRVRSNILADPALIRLDRDLDPVRAGVDMQVQTAPAARVSAFDAADRALGTPAFAQWLVAFPARTWSGASLRWTDGAWRVEVRSTTGSSAILSVDGDSGITTVLKLDR